LAIAEIAGSRAASDRRDDGIPAWIGRSKPLYDVPLRKAKWFEEAISLRALVQSLSFIQNKEGWGTALQGGITRIPAEDFAKIVEKRATLPLKR